MECQLSRPSEALELGADQHGGLVRPSRERTWTSEDGGRSIPASGHIRWRDSEATQSAAAFTFLGTHLHDAEERKAESLLIRAITGGKGFQRSPSFSFNC